jgi:hypothetical protein
MEFSAKEAYFKKGKGSWSELAERLLLFGFL